MKDNKPSIEGQCIVNGYNIAIEGSLIVCPSTFIAKVVKVDKSGKVLKFGITKLLQDEENLRDDLSKFLFDNFWKKIYAPEYRFGSIFECSYEACDKIFNFEPFFVYERKKNIPVISQFVKPKEAPREITPKEILDLYPVGSQVRSPGKFTGVIVKIYEENAFVDQKAGWVVKVLESFDSNEEILPDFPVLKFITRGSVIMGKVKLEIV